MIQVEDISDQKWEDRELAVRKIVHGELVLNREALANPEALDLFLTAGRCLMRWTQPPGRVMR